MNKKNKIRIILVAVLIAAVACIGIFAGVRLGSARRAEDKAESASSASARRAAKDESLAEAASRAALLAASESAAEKSRSAAEAEESALSAAEEQRKAANRDDAAMLMTVGGIAVGNVAEEYEARNQTLASTPTPAASAAPVPQTGNGHIVCIDPGHQDHGMSETEPNGPGSSTMKAKLTTGTYGRTSGKNEYEVNLEVGLKLRDALQSAGYTVVMTRESNDVNISNVERAQIANNAGADIFVRLHCNGSDSTSANGVLCYEPTESNAYLSSEVISGSQRLARTLVDAQCAATGQRNLGVIDGDDMTGINWAQMPVTIVEMGFMSNPDEDLYLSSDEGQAAIVQGLTNGINSYFGS